MTMLTLCALSPSARLEKAAVFLTTQLIQDRNLRLTPAFAEELMKRVVTRATAAEIAPALLFVQTVCWTVAAAGPPPAGLLEGTLTRRQQQLSQTRAPLAFVPWNASVYVPIVEYLERLHAAAEATHDPDAERASPTDPLAMQAAGPSAQAAMTLIQLIGDSLWRDLRYHDTWVPGLAKSRAGDLWRRVCELWVTTMARSTELPLDVSIWPHWASQAKRRPPLDQVAVRAWTTAVTSSRPANADRVVRLLLAMHRLGLVQLPLAWSAMVPAALRQYQAQLPSALAVTDGGGEALGAALELLALTLPQQAPVDPPPAQLSESAETDGGDATHPAHASVAVLRMLASAALHAHMSLPVVDAVPTLAPAPLRATLQQLLQSAGLSAADIAATLTPQSPSGKPVQLPAPPMLLPLVRHLVRSGLGEAGVMLWLDVLPLLYREPHAPLAVPAESRLAELAGQWRTVVACEYLRRFRFEEAWLIVQLRLVTDDSKAGAVPSSAPQPLLLSHLARELCRAQAFAMTLSSAAAALPTSAAATSAPSAPVAPGDWPHLMATTGRLLPCLFPTEAPTLPHGPPTPANWSAIFHATSFVSTHEAASTAVRVRWLATQVAANPHSFEVIHSLLGGLLLLREASEALDVWRQLQRAEVLRLRDAPDDVSRHHLGRTSALRPTRDQLECLLELCVLPFSDTALSHATRRTAADLAGEVLYTAIHVWVFTAEELGYREQAEGARPRALSWVLRALARAEAAPESVYEWLVLGHRLGCTRRGAVHMADALDRLVDAGVYAVVWDNYLGKLREPLNASARILPAVRDTAAGTRSGSPDVATPAQAVLPADAVALPALSVGPRNRFKLPWAAMWRGQLDVTWQSPHLAHLVQAQTTL